MISNTLVQLHTLLMVGLSVFALRFGWFRFFFAMPWLVWSAFTYNPNRECT